MGLLHDETNTKLSIEQPMDLKPQKDVINLSTHSLSVSHKPASIQLPGGFLSESVEEGVRVEELRQI